MPEIISNTSPFQYLHQLGLLDLLPSLFGSITVPPAVVEELEAGRALGLDLPNLSSLNWVIVRSLEKSTQPPHAEDLGRGETDVLRLAIEVVGEVVLILDDARAREAAQAMGLKFTGTLGVLLDAKRKGLLQAIKPQLDRLDALGFRLARRTCEAILNLAGEAT